MRATLCAFGLGLFVTAAALADEASPPLPSFEPCRKQEHPLLPEKWRGLYLMAPFVKAQLTLADIVYDGAVDAMRVRLHGLKGGSADLLVSGGKTYLLGEGGPSSCRAMGDTGLKPLPRDLLAHEARCEGSAPIGGVLLDWWKTPSSSKPVANWIWYYRDAGGSPFRLMVTQPDDRLSILGRYSFTYQVRFEAVAETGLKTAVTSCEANATPYEAQGRAGLQKLITDMEQSQIRDDAAIASLMPELEPACPQQPLPGWAEQAAMGAFMTSPAFKDAPFPTEVLYDGAGKKMRTRMFFPPRSELATDDALLLDGYGYSVSRTRGRRLTCSNSLPGAVRSNWPETGGCSCEASIKGDTPLTPYGAARVLVCPMTPPRVVWAWFAQGGRPQVFMETAAPGDDPTVILALVDYTSWAPGHAPASTAFAAPSQCHPHHTLNTQPASQRSMQGASRDCGACHLDQIAGR